MSDSGEVLSWRLDKDRFSGLHHVAGVDISFVKESPNQACAMITVLNFPELKVGQPPRVSIPSTCMSACDTGGPLELCSCSDD